MDSYIEQSVSREKDKAKPVLYGLCWSAVILLLIPAMFFASGVFGNNPDTLDVNWLNLVLTCAVLAVAFGIFRWKDHLRMEYDYVLRGTVLEISGIYNARRRRMLAEIPLERIQQMGPITAAQIQKLSKHPRMKHHNWCLNMDAHKYYLIYMKENIRHTVFLEFSDEMIVAIRKSGKLSGDAWRNEEGKTSDYASLS